VGKFMVAVARVVPLCALLLLLPAIAVAQVSVTLQPDRGQVGTGVTAVGTGWPAGTEVWIYFESQVVGGPVIPDGHGAFSTTFCVPNRQPGLYPVFFTNGRENFAPSFTLTAGSPGNCQGQAPPRITLKPSPTSLQPGDTHILTAIVTPGGSASPVDVYVALQLPDQTLHFYQFNGSFTQEVQPLVSNWTVRPFDGEIFRYTFSGAEQAGTYTWSAGFADPGTLNFIGEIAQATFTFSSPQANCPLTQSSNFWYVAGIQCYTAVGAYAKMSQAQPRIDPENARAGGHSLAEIGVSNAFSNGIDAIEVGWIVSPIHFGSPGIAVVTAPKPRRTPSKSLKKLGRVFDNVQISRQFRESLHFNDDLPHLFVSRTISSRFAHF
jgi:hypothetical protein